MLLSRFPRVRLVQAPTPLEPLDRLSAALGGPRILVKRDDQTGLASGGNKTRKLEFLMAEAIAQGCDTVVTQGAVQSNHVRQTAAAAAKLGLKCEVLLEHRRTNVGEPYLRSGNPLLNRIFGAETHERPSGLDMNAELERFAEELRTQRGEKVYAIPGGGSNATGALGYAACALELVGQLYEAGVAPAALVHATGSAGTQAGLLAGLHAANADLPVLGISVRAPKERQEANVHALAEATAAKLGVRGGVPREAVFADDGFVGPGYGEPTPEMIEAIELLARTEGILLDPVYSGKGMAGLVAMIRAGRFGRDETVVFLHTGGSVALFGYPELFGA